MLNYPYDVGAYTSTLKSEVTKLTSIAIILALIFIFAIVYFAVQIKKDRRKKAPYFYSLLSIMIGTLLLFSLGSQIGTFTKDITEKTYIQYVGPVNVREDHQIVFGGIPTGYTEYIISFEQDGKNVELAMRKDHGRRGYIENVYIVYAKHSNFILELVE